MGETAAGTAKLTEIDERINRGLARQIEAHDNANKDKLPEPLSKDDAEDTFLREVVGHDPPPAEPPAEPEFVRDIVQNETPAEDSNMQGNEDSVMIGAVTYDSEMIGLLCTLGVSTKSFQRENRAARRRMVAELYSPPRVTRAISAMPRSELLAGFALDVTCVDPDDGLP